MTSTTEKTRKLVFSKLVSSRDTRAETPLKGLQPIPDLERLVRELGGTYRRIVKLNYKGKAKREWRQRLEQWKVNRAARVHKRDRPRCGARCRDGHACNARAVWDDSRNAPMNGRCRMHGGLSTGARTAEGLERIRAAQRLRWQRWRVTKAGQS
jgi:hypothetical protein